MTYTSLDESNVFEIVFCSLRYLHFCTLSVFYYAYCDGPLPQVFLFQTKPIPGSPLGAQLLHQKCVKLVW